MPEPLTPERRREIRSYVEWQISQVDPKKAVCYTMLPLPDLSQKIALLDALDAAEARIAQLDKPLSNLNLFAYDPDIPEEREQLRIYLESQRFFDMTSRYIYFCLGFLNDKDDRIAELEAEALKLKCAALSVDIAAETGEDVAPWGRCGICDGPKESLSAVICKQCQVEKLDD